MKGYLAVHTDKHLAALARDSGDAAGLDPTVTYLDGEGKEHEANVADALKSYLERRGVGSEPAVNTAKQIAMHAAMASGIDVVTATDRPSLVTVQQSGSGTLMSSGKIEDGRDGRLDVVQDESARHRCQAPCWSTRLCYVPSEWSSRQRRPRARS